MTYKRPECTKCYGYGYVQSYLGGRVKRIYCACAAGVCAEAREKNI